MLCRELRIFNALKKRVVFLVDTCCECLSYSLYAQQQQVLYVCVAACTYLSFELSY